MDVGDEQDWLGFKVSLWPQERDLIPSEAGEQTAFQTCDEKFGTSQFRWQLQRQSHAEEGKLLPKVSQEIS